MKNYLSIVILLFLGLSLNAQAPQGFNYQATVRNASGDLVVNQNVYFKFNIMQGSQTSLPAFTEIHYVPTDDLGQVSLVIGQGTATTGAFSDLDWSQGSFYLGIELDTGSGYVAMGTTQLLSVPYALYAENSGNAETSTPSLESVLEVNNSANNQKITNLLNPTSDQDAATKYYVDDEINNSSQTLEQVLADGNNANGLQIKGLANPTDLQDAVNLEVLNSQTQPILNQITELNNQIDDLQNQLTDIYQNLIDGDGDGFTPSEGDCDDSNAQVYPNAIEICDGIDNDCDGIIDGGAETEYFVDSDGDGYGFIQISVLACSQPDGYVGNSDDCDDSNSIVNPGAVEACNQSDDNCNGEIDEGLAMMWYYDLDNDGFGDPDNSWFGCPQPEDAVMDNTDCDDSNSSVYPGAEEIYDDIDNDCDGVIDAGTFTDQNGNSMDFIVYPPTSSIPSQTWAVENAKVTTYRDGTPIPEITAPGAWIEATTGAYCITPQGEKLYNWYAVQGIHDNDPNTPNKDFAPQGWRVATSSDFNDFETILVYWGFVFPSSSSDNSIGKPIASQSDWINEFGTSGVPAFNPSLNNSSGFNLRPLGYRSYINANYYNFSELAQVWLFDGPQMLNLNGYFPDPSFYGQNEKDGKQVRFIKD